MWICRGVALVAVPDDFGEDSTAALLNEPLGANKEAARGGREWKEWDEMGRRNESDPREINSPKQHLVHILCLHGRGVEETGTTWIHCTPPMQHTKKKDEKKVKKVRNGSRKGRDPVK